MNTFTANPSLAYTSPNSVGNVLVIMFYLLTASVPTVTDTQGNTWVHVGTSQVSNGGASHSFTFVCLNCAAGANTVTVNAGGFQGAIALLLEATGFVSPTTENWTGKASALAADNTASITPSTANSLVCAMSQPNGNSFCTVSAPFVGGSNATGSFSQGGYLVRTSSAPTAANFTGMGGDNGLTIFDITSTAPPASAKGNVCIMT